MGLQEVMWHLQGVNAANREKWRMVRRVCFVLGKTMGGYKGDEEGMWKIEGDVKQKVGYDKIEAWKKRLIEIGKIKQ